MLLIVAAIGAMLHGRPRIADGAIDRRRGRRRRPTDVGAAAGRARAGARAVRTPISYFLMLSALLFTIGTVGVLVRRNALVIFMSVELQLNAVNLALVAFSRMHGDLTGQVVAFFSMAVAAAEVVVGLAIIVAIYRRAGAATSTTPTSSGGEPDRCDRLDRLCTLIWLVPPAARRRVVLLFSGRRTRRAVRRLDRDGR